MISSYTDLKISTLNVHKNRKLKWELKSFVSEHHLGLEDFGKKEGVVGVDRGNIAGVRVGRFG